MRIALFGHGGKVGSVLGPALEAAGHEVTPIGRSDRIESVRGHDVAIDFTRPDVVYTLVSRCLEESVPCIVGTSGLGPEELEDLDGRARSRSVALVVAPNFAVGAVLMMRFSAEAARHLSHAEIVELHHETKLDKPSGTARATAALIGEGTPIHSVRLPGLVAHQEVIFGGAGQTLTIRHDTSSRDAFVPGVLLALERLPTLPPGLTFGLDALL